MDQFSLSVGVALNKAAAQPKGDTLCYTPLAGLAATERLHRTVLVYYFVVIGGLFDINSSRFRKPGYTFVSSKR
jgi:hypothetical protein